MVDRQNEWIARRLKELGLKNRDLATALGLEPPRITEIIKGERKVQTSELEPLARALQLSPDVVRQAINQKSTVFIDKLTNRLDNRKSVMVKAEIQAGAWNEALYWPDDKWYPVPVFDDVLDIEELEGFKVVGDSMDLIYPPGSVVICRRFNPLRHIPPVGKRVVIQRRDMNGLIEATVKLLVQDERGEAWLVPESTNPAHQRTAFRTNGDGDDDTEIVGVVIASYRKE